MPRRIKRSRLVRTEDKRLKRQTFLMFLASIAILIGIIFWGIPALIRMAVFFGELRDSSQPIGQEDTIAPSPPQLYSLPTATVSGKLTIQGFAEPESIVTLFRSGAKLTDTITGNDGDFSFPGVSLRAGENKFYVTATDQAGNESDQSPRSIVIYDAEPPSLTINSPSDGDEIFGESKRTITVSGSSDPGAEISVNGRFALVDSEGSFSTTIQLNEGDNTITVIATDQAQNETKQEIKIKYQL